MNQEFHPSWHWRMQGVLDLAVYSSKTQIFHKKVTHVNPVTRLPYNNKFLALKSSVTIIALNILTIN